MIALSRARRVRLHYFDGATPSVEGLLTSRRHHEYVIDIPELVTGDENVRVLLESKRLLVPREAVSMLEVLS